MNRLWMHKAGWMLKVALLAVLVFFSLRKMYHHFVAPSFPHAGTAYLSMSGEKVELPGDRFVLVSFFQTWCRDCVSELPHIRNLLAKTGTGKLSVMMVSDEEIPKLEAFRSRWNVEVPIVRPGNQSLSDMGIRVFPTTYLLSPSGEVLMSKTEGYDWDNEEVIRMIKK